jgi:hypothetical protein
MDILASIIIGVSTNLRAFRTSSNWGDAGHPHFICITVEAKCLTAMLFTIFHII